MMRARAIQRAALTAATMLAIVSTGVAQEPAKKWSVLDIHGPSIKLDYTVDPRTRDTDFSVGVAVGR